MAVNQVFGNAVLLKKLPWLVSAQHIFDVLCLLLIFIPVQSRIEKENSNREAAARAEEHKKKKLATQKKAAECEHERDLKNKSNCKHTSFNVFN